MVDALPYDQRPDDHTPVHTVDLPDTLVLPGHGKPTTIGEERPHLQEWIDRGW